LNYFPALYNVVYNTTQAGAAFSVAEGPQSRLSAKYCAMSSMATSAHAIASCNIYEFWP